ncbi:MAG: DUF2877 domain-containing protein [Elusimicrobia bacterium]|nr:DUF2877 domain-containing protein [Elusimicrobiota bacterium]
MVRPGVYRLHSRFDSVLNFFDGDRLVSLVTARVGPGPANMVMDGPLPSALDSLEVSSAGLKLGGSLLTFDHSAVYRSALGAGRPDRLKADRGLEALEGWLARRAPSGSLAFLVGAPAGRPCGGFEKKEREWVRRACLKLFYSELQAGARMLKGIGRGLTPSGDDFLCGSLAALDVIERLSGRDLTRMKDAVLRNALGGNPLCNAFLGFARRGRYDERQKGLLKAVLAADEPMVEVRARALARFGATSGADWMTGLVAAMKGWRELWS